MKKPVLVIMAAGMGSRYGGLKQIDPIDKYRSRLQALRIRWMKGAEQRITVWGMQKEMDRLATAKRMTAK